MNWLSQVIAGKRQPLSLDISVAREGPARQNGETSAAAHTAATVETLRRIFSQPSEPAQPEPAPVSSPEGATMAAAAAPEALPIPSPAASFTAEDLCGAPAVPLIMAVPSSADEITAADVCWVPPGRELRPAPSAVALAEPEAAPSSEPAGTLAAAQPEPAAPEAPKPPSANLESGEPDRRSVDEALSRIEASINAAATTAPETAANAEAEPAPEVAAEAAPETVAGPVPEPASESQPEPPQVETAASAVEAPAIAAQTADAQLAEAPAITEQAAEGQTVEEPAIAAQAEHPTADAPAQSVDAPSQPGGISASEPPPAETPGEPAPADSAAALPLEAPQTEPTEEQAVVPPEAAEQAHQPIAATESVESAPVEPAPVEPAPAESAAEVAPEAMPQETTATAPENVFADGAIWRVAAEMAASQGAPVPRDSSEADPAQEDAAALTEDEPLLSESPDSMEPTETSAPPSASWVEAMKALMRLNPVMPWLNQAKSGEDAKSAASEIRDQVAGIRLVQYETRTAVQDQASQMKRMEENLARIREAVQSAAGQNVAESVKSTARAVRIALLGTGLTLALVLVMIGMLLAHSR